MYIVALNKTINNAGNGGELTFILPAFKDK